MLKLRNVVVLLVILFLVWSIAIQAQATNLTLDLTNFATTGNTVTDDTTNTITNSATGGEATLNVATNQATSVVQPVANSSANSATAGNNLPQTGVTEDITVMFFIVVCVIAAIYAYKKIRDYRV